jgi:hypothetical protein
MQRVLQLIEQLAMSGDRTIATFAQVYAGG